MADTQKTFALVVGIEAYTADARPLNGPALDAVKFIGWLRERGVPDTNIHAYLSPLEKNLAAVQQCGLPFQPATQSNLQDFIEHILPGLQGELLFLFWGGHGMVQPDQDRRLFYADVDGNAKRNLNLDSLLNTLRTDRYQNLPRQIGIIDTCANYLYDLEVKLPNYTFAPGQPLGSQKQYVFFAASPGDYAKNDDAQQTGYFSREILQALQASTTTEWPPDMRAIEDVVQTRFVTLRTEGKTKQSPASVVYTDWNAGIRTFADSISVHVMLVTHASIRYADLTPPQRREVLQDFLACSTMKQLARRDAIVLQLRSDIANNITRSQIAIDDVSAILTTCDDYLYGLRELVEVMQMYENDSLPMQKVVQTLQRLLPDALP